MKNRAKENFTIVVNEVLNNENLTLKAKGLYSFLCSKPDDWDFSYDGLAYQLKEGEKAIRSAVRELVETKLLLRLQKPKVNGYFTGWDWIINPTDEDLLNGIDPMGVIQNGGIQNGNDRNGQDQNGNDISNTNLIILKNNIEEKKEKLNSEFSFSLKKESQYDNLSAEYKAKLEVEIRALNMGLRYEDFVDSLMAKGYKYKNFLLAYKNWAKKDFNSGLAARPKTIYDDMAQQGKISKQMANGMAILDRVCGDDHAN